MKTYVFTIEVVIEQEADSEIEAYLKICKTLPQSAEVLTVTAFELEPVE